MNGYLVKMALLIGTALWCATCFTPLGYAADNDSQRQYLKKSSTAAKPDNSAGNYLPAMEQDFDQALHFMEAEDWEKALDLLQELHKQWPDNKQITNNLAVTYFYLGRIDRAQNLFAEVLEASKETRTSFKNLQFLYGYVTAEAYRQGLGIDKKNKLPAMILKRSLKQPWDEVPTELAEPASTTEKIAAYPATATNNRTPAINKSEEDIHEVEECLSKWAAAWSAGNCQDFLSYYLPDYAPQDLSRTAWIKDRKRKVRPEKEISVNLELKAIGADGKNGGIVTTFVQNYSSRNYKDRVVKKMVWAKHQGKWLISHEEIVKSADIVSSKRN